jgi:DNA polymerase-3 subunit epsilon
LPNYKLANVCEALNISFGETHRAEADAIACAQVVLSLSRLEGVETLEELSSLLGVSPGTLSDSDFRGTKSHRTGFQSSLGKGAAAEYRASLADEDMALDEDFNGKEVIFTGGLVSMDRKTAQERVISAGGFTGNNVTKKTAIVVVGSPYDSSLKPGAELSGKLQKVLDLRATGADIELLTESEFLELFEN